MPFMCMDVAKGSGRGMDWSTDKYTRNNSAHFLTTLISILNQQSCIVTGKEDICSWVSIYHQYVCRSSVCMSVSVGKYHQYVCR